MKIFELIWTKQDEKEWIAANTNIEALQIYLAITGIDISELDEEDFIQEVPEEEWENLVIRNIEFDESKNENDENYREMTFAQWMKFNNKPDIIAGTMYD